MPRRVVLIGATGFFGRRLGARLAAMDGIDLTVTSRHADRAEDLAKGLAGGRKPTALAFERDDLESVARLMRSAPWLVIDASGPFQSANYDLARAAIGAGSHWIDLADARGYLLGFGDALNETAVASGVVARAGASSTPALSMAAVTALTQGWRRVDSIDIAIMPGGAADVGEAVVRAILSYSGRPITTFAEGRAQAITGWGSIRRLVVDQIGVRYVSPVETADAALMATRFGVTSRVSFSAGLESRAEQFGLWVLAGLRQRGVISNLEPIAPLLVRARAITRAFASDVGGMIVECAGLDREGRHSSARWRLHAKAGQGPDVPVLAAVALTRALMRGTEPIGAAIAELPLWEVEAEMQAPLVVTSRATTIDDGSSLIERASGGSYGNLPSALKAFHDQAAFPVWTGKADIDASNSLIGRMLRRVFGFPSPGREVEVTVTVDRNGGEEIWTRNFGGRRFHSRLSYDGGNVVCERFGPFGILLGIHAACGEIAMPVVGWRIGRMPFPLFLAPKSEAREFVGEDGRFHFDVAIRIPIVGRLAHYRGWLVPRVAASVS